MKRMVALGTALSLAALLLAPAAALAAPPQAGDDSYSVSEGGSLVVAAPGVLNNDSDIDGDLMSAVKDSDPAHGTVSLDADGGFSYSPDADYFGPDAFTYHVEANGESSQTATVEITVNAVNDPPSGTLDTTPVIVAEDSGPATDPGRVTDISEGPGESQPISFSVTPANPALFAAGPTINAAGTLSFTPAANAFGSSDVSVSISDGQSSVALGSFSLTITANDDPPSGVLDTTTMTVAENSGPATDPGRVTAISAGPGESQAITLTATPGNASLFSAGPAISPTGTLTFTPATGANGSTSVSVSISDGQTSVGLGSFTISITAIDDPPTGTLDATLMTVAEDSGPATDLGRVSGISPGPPDEAGQSVTVTATPGTAALFAAGPTISPTGTLTFTPAANANGSTAVAVSISDGTTSVPLGSFTISITAVNDLPVGVADGYATSEDVPLVVAAPGVLVNDSDVDGGTLTATRGAGTTNPTNGTISQSANGGLTYTPTAQAFGTDTYTYRARDAANTFSAWTTVTITITSVNDPPTFSLGPNPEVAEDAGPQVVPGFLTNVSPGPANESGQTTARQPLVVSDPALFTSTGQPTIDDAGTLRFRPASNKSGASQVTVTINDSGGTANGGDASTSQAFIISVGSANDPPFANPDPETAASYAIEAGIWTPLDVLANDITNDPGETLTIVSATRPGHGSVAIASGGTGLSYRSTTGYVGDDTFRYTISDGTSTASTTVDVTVADTQPPTLGSLSPRFKTGARLPRRTVLVRLAWSASDVGSGIKSYDIQRSVDGGLTWATIVAGTTATRNDQNLALNRAYSFRFRARDRHNRTSAWSPAVTVRPARYQDTTSEATYSSGWKMASIATASGGHTKYAKLRGSTSTFTLTGRAVSLVAPRSRGRGKAEIRVDGVLVATVDLRHRTTDYRRHVWSRSWTVVGTHVVNVRVLGTSGRPRFDVDAWTVLR